MEKGDSEELFNYKGHNLSKKLMKLDLIETAEDFETRDSDIFIDTYPKSGTIWTQNIVCLILYEGHRNGTENIPISRRGASIEYNVHNVDITQLPSRRVIMSHLPYYLVPKTLRAKKGKDLRGTVLKICKFIGKELSSQEVDKVVEMSSFKNMKADPRANIVKTYEECFGLKNITHLRKGTVGDWKNIMTVSQSERFDNIFQAQMKDIALKFIWDLKEIQSTQHGKLQEPLQENKEQKCSTQM